ncbi:hypothetical protein MRX96_030727 [Rhipicephalus microplus]
MAFRPGGKPELAPSLAGSRDQLAARRARCNDVQPFTPKHAAAASTNEHRPKITAVANALARIPSRYSGAVCFERGKKKNAAENEMALRRGRLLQSSGSRRTKAKRK